jgi:hypothetical protein
LQIRTPGNSPHRRQVADAAVDHAEERDDRGLPPSPMAPPFACFRTRCPRADKRSAEEIPALNPIAPGQHVACHHPLI